MHVEIKIQLHASNLKTHEPETVEYASVVVLDIDSTDRAIARYMDANPVVADAIESGLATIETVELWKGLMIPIRRGKRQEIKAPHWSKMPSIDPAIDEFTRETAEKELDDIDAERVQFDPRFDAHEPESFRENGDY